MLANSLGIHATCGQSGLTEGSEHLEFALVTVLLISHFGLYRTLGSDIAFFIAMSHVQSDFKCLQ